MTKEEQYFKVVPIEGMATEPVTLPATLHYFEDQPVILTPFDPELFSKQRAIVFETWRRIQERAGNQEIYRKTPGQLYEIFDKENQSPKPA